MTLEKAIRHGKEKRKPYYDSRAIDPTCRNNKGCPCCKSNRTHADRKRKLAAEEDCE